MKSVITSSSNTPLSLLAYEPYIPTYRLSSSVIASAWGKPLRRSERAVANYDEDSLTLAAAATLGCLSGGSSLSLDALHFISTNPPLLQPSCAGKLAIILDLKATTQLLDAGGSFDAVLRSITMMHTDSRHLVLSGEMQTPKPGTDNEAQLGDAGCALLLGSSSPESLADIIGVYAQVADSSTSWQRREDIFPHFQDVRFGQVNYQKTLSSLITTALKQFQIEASQIAHLALGSPEARSVQVVAKKLGFPSEVVVTAPQDQIGFTGCCDAPLALIAALEKAKPDEYILWASAHDGGVAILLQAKAALMSYTQRGMLEKALKSGKPLEAYARYLSFRNLIAGSQRAEAGFASEIMLSREETKNLRLHGKRCQKCGRVITLDLKICPGCRAKGSDLEIAKLARQGRLFTSTAEYYYPCPDPPLGMAVVDLDGGGRLTLQLADQALGTPQIGEKLELALRRYHDAGGLPHYYWKARRVENSIS